MSFNSPTSMLFPSYVNGVLINKDDGMLSPDWNIYFAQLTQQLQVNFSNEGITLPSQDTANIANLVTTNLTTHNLNNKMFVNSDTGDVNIILDGVLKTFTVT